MPSRPFAVTVSDLAHSLSIPVSAIRALADAGYLCKTPSGNGYKIVRSKVPKRFPMRIVDRISIALWLLGLDEAKRIPSFCVYIEREIIRIAKLREPMRTEQAYRMLRRYRDAEEIVKAVSRMRSDDVAAAETRLLSEKHTHRLMSILGRQLVREEKNQARRPAPRSSPPIHAAAPSEFSRKPRPAAGR